MKADDFRESKYGVTVAVMALAWKSEGSGFKPWRLHPTSDRGLPKKEPTKIFPALKFALNA